MSVPTPGVPTGRGNPRFAPLHAATDEDLVAELVAMAGSPAGAVLRVAQLAGVAVFYQDRQCFEVSLDVQLTDEEWALVADGIGDFDERIGTLYGVSDAVGDWMEDRIREAGLDLRALEERTRREREGKP
jgi:hypothetical protein